MGLPLNSTNSSFKNKEAVVGFVTGRLQALKPGYASIIIITPEKSEGFCVRTVIDLLSEDTETLTYLEELLNIWPKEQVG